MTCSGSIVTYLSPMLGSVPIWVDMNGDGQLQRFAIVYASDYLNGDLLFEKSFGVKAGYGPVVRCTHYADFGGGIVITGDLWLATAPA